MDCGVSLEGFEQLRGEVKHKLVYGLMFGQIVNLFENILHQATLLYVALIRLTNCQNQIMEIRRMEAGKCCNYIYTSKKLNIYIRNCDRYQLSSAGVLDHC